MMSTFHYSRFDRGLYFAVRPRCLFRGPTAVPYCVPSAYQVLNSSYFGISSELAFGSMQTCTTAVLPLAYARSMAGPISSSFSTYSPWQPKPSAILSNRTSLLQCTPGCGDGCSKVRLYT